MKKIHLFLAALLLSLAAQSAFASWSFTANNASYVNTSFSSTSTGFHPCSFTNQAANNTVYCAWCLAASITFTSFTDNASDSWTTDAGTSDGTWKCYVSYAKASTYSGTNYTTLAFTGGPSAVGYVSASGELTGGPASPTVVFNSATGSSTSATVNLASLTSGSAVIDITMNLVNSAPTAGGSYTCMGGAGCSNSGTYGFGAAYNLSSGSGAVTANFTQTTGTWSIMALAFEGGGPTTSPSQFFLGASLWQRPVSLEAMAR